MKRLINFIFAMAISVLAISFALDDNKVGLYYKRNHPPSIIELINPDLTIKEGYLSQKKETIKIVRNKKVVAKVKLGKPSLVVQAKNQEKWGHFQFPSIEKTDDGTLVVTWYMGSDSHKDFGNPADVKVVPKMSKDGGKTWVDRDKVYATVNRGYNVNMVNGNKLKVIAPASKDIRSYKNFPKRVAKKGNYGYYSVQHLPEDLQGAYFLYTKNEQKPETLHGRVNDSILMRRAIGKYMPVVWWGNIKEMADHSLIAGVYPCFYLDSEGVLMRSSVGFYQSKDEGHTWDVISRIYYREDGIAEVRGEDGYEEPAFEVLQDSTFLCVIRTGSFSPMYKTISYDRGMTWAKTKPFTPNGVKPQLMQLENGVIVLASGRPGVQLRFCLDGKGDSWTEPIEMVPFMRENGTYEKYSSCGYVSLIDAGSDSFYIVYSDFTTKNERGEIRKSIWSRKVEVCL